MGSFRWTHGRLVASKIREHVVLTRDSGPSPEHRRTTCAYQRSICGFTILGREPEWSAKKDQWSDENE